MKYITLSELAEILKTYCNQDEVKHSYKDIALMAAQLAASLDDEQQKQNQNSTPYQEYLKQNNIILNQG